MKFLHFFFLLVSKPQDPCEELVVYLCLDKVCVAKVLINDETHLTGLEVTGNL